MINEKQMYVGTSWLSIWEQPEHSGRVGLERSPGLGLGLVQANFWVEYLPQVDYS